jgi:DNA-directed RNA polymerases I, II, and III subunit RPABC2
MTEEEYDNNDYDNEGDDDDDEVFEIDNFIDTNNDKKIISYDDIIKKNKNIKKKTVPFLNKFERARLIGVRIQQLSSGAQPKICTKGFNSIKDIVEEELIQRKIPLIIKRILPNGESEEWRLEEFEKV